MAPERDFKHLIVGTAGHVDHGKTTLIKAMTGINTDRLKEEQERGLTIDLGFASLTLPSGRTVGIVDVPGHEKFLKNMLAGASGVDIALLVVAADEGVMPQTREHLEILELLETRQGVVALTKSDMVEDEWLEIVEEDLREALKSTFLRDAKMVRVSGVTGQGVDQLIREIDRLADSAVQRTTEGPFRLPVDRIFTMTGFGTVVTGTLVSGTMRIGDPVVVLPERIESRVRQLQVHGKKQEAVQAGSRVAVNLVGVDVDDLERGSVVIPPGYLQPTTTLDAYVRVLKESPRPLKSRTRIRFHIGTAEVIGRAMILGAEEIAPGEKGYLQLRLEEEVVAARGDRFVLRFYSPTRVLGGGVILDPSALRHKRFDKSIIERLGRTLKGEPSDMVEDVLAISGTGLVLKEISQRTGLTEQETRAALEELSNTGRAMRVSGRYMQSAAYEMMVSRVRSALASYHAANPTKPGMPREELRASLGARLDSKSFGAVMGPMVEAGEVVATEAMVKLPDHVPTLNDAQRKLADGIEKEFRGSGTNPPLVAETLEKYGPGADEILAYLVDRGDLVKISPELLFHRDAIEKAEGAVREFLSTHSGMTVAQFRDLIDSSRKYVVPLLEFFDKNKFTRRIGDERILVK